MDFGWFWYWYQLRCLTSVLPLNLGATLISINPGDMKMRNTQLLQSLLGVLLWIYWIYIVISPFINSESKQRNLKGFPWSLWSNSLRLLTQHIFNKGNHFKTPCGFGTKDCAEDLPSGFSAAMNGRSTRKELGKWFLVCVTIYQVNEVLPASTKTDKEQSLCWKHGVFTKKQSFPTQNPNHCFCVS